MAVVTVSRLLRFSPSDGMKNRIDSPGVDISSHISLPKLWTVLRLATGYLSNVRHKEHGKAQTIYDGITHTHKHGLGFVRFLVRPRARTPHTVHVHMTFVQASARPRVSPVETVKSAVDQCTFFHVVTARKKQQPRACRDTEAFAPAVVLIVLYALRAVWYGLR